MGVMAVRGGSRLRNLGFSLLLLVASSLGAELAAPAQSQFVQRPEEDLLLLEVRLGRSVLSDAIVAYPTPGGGILLPLGELADLLEFAIQADVLKGRAAGWILDPSRTFTLNVPARRVIVAGEERSFEATRVELHPDEIFVDASLLSQWWPVDFRVEMSVLVLHVQPRERLPVQVRAERAQERAKLDARDTRQQRKLPLVNVPWTDFAGPFIDSQLRLRLLGSEDNTELETYHSTHAAAELFRHTGTFFASGTEDSPFGDVRASLGRTDIEGQLLGIGATEYRVGEVFLPGDALTVPPGAGPGLLFTNRPLDQQSEATSHTFRGELPAGWEVELFRNEALIAYQISRGDGLYEFRDVPLQSGVNVFRLMFYGPRGEVREELRTYSIAESLAEPGELRYRVIGADVRQHDRRGLAEAEYGLREGLAAGGAFSSDVLQSGEEKHFARAHLAGFRRGIFARGDLASDGDGGFAARLLSQLRVGRTDLTLEHVETRDYVSDVFPRLLGPMARRSRARLDGLAPAWIGSPYLGIDTTRDEAESGDVIYTIDARASRQLERTFMTLLVRSRFGEGSPIAESEQTEATFLASRFVRNTSLRGEIQWRIQPEAEVANVGFSADRFIQDIDALARVTVRHEVNANQTSLVGSLNRYEGLFSWGAEVMVDDDGRWSAAALIGASVLRDDRTGRVRTFARNYAYAGAASIRIFLDRNANGSFDSDDEPVPGAEVFVDNSSFNQASNDEGVILVPGLSSERFHTVALSTSTLEDPLWVPAQREYRFHARQGRTSPIDLPVLVTGEVVGTAYLDRNGATTPASGLVLELVDSSGQISAQTITAYDGFYEFVRVHPGSYQLRVGEDRRGRDLVLPEARKIEIAPDGSIHEGIDFVIKVANQ